MKPPNGPWNTGTVLAAGAVFLGGLAVWGADTLHKAASDSSHLSPADRLVREALAAELVGDNRKRDELLAQSLKEDPDSRAARWHSGFVSLDGKWLTPDDAAQRFSADRNLAEYRRRRAAIEATGVFARRTVTAIRGAADGDRTDGGLSMYSSAVVESERSAALSPAALQAHADLARWCRSKRLADEERAHWSQVLLEVHHDKEAESRLGLHWFRGGLYTNAQIDAIKKRSAAEDQQRADWKATVLRWRDALDNGAAPDRAAATAEMQELRDPTAIPAIESACISDSAKPPANGDAASAFQTEAIALLGRMPEQRATYSLTGHSVLANQAEVRAAAALELKKRPLHDFVPLLLSGLANPIEFEVATSFDAKAGLATYHTSVRQEGRDTITQIESSTSAAGLVPKIVGRRDTVIGHTISVDLAHIKPTTSSSWRSESGSAAISGARPAGESRAISFAGASGNGPSVVDGRNDQIARMNRRINFVMERVTNISALDVTDRPDDADVIPDSSVSKHVSSLADFWWDWWADYNGSYSPPKQIAVIRYASGSYTGGDNYIQTISYSNSVVPYNSASTGSAVLISHTRSCFAAGTLVTTQTGAAAIEKLQIGDRVLAQDADSGEVAFKPVLGTTVRPPVEMVLVTTTRGELRTTRGHPFWIVGKGWRMAKELQIGDRVVNLGGSATVTALAKQPPESAYNLIVADFGTYFVGDGRILVHDNTPRLPTPAAIPGFVADSR